MSLRLASLLILAVHALPVSGEAAELPTFASWSAEFGRAYATVEEAALRARIYAANVRAMAAHNALGEPWRMGVNQFSDLTGAEFRARVTGGYHATTPSHALPAPPASSAPPGSIDWSARGAVTGVKNQGGCGSCWAFSAVAAIEGAHFLKSGSLVSLSEQNVCSCASKNGCGGGSMVGAFNWVKENGGLCSESAYPYKAHNEACHGGCAKIAPLDGAVEVAGSNEGALRDALASRPVSVAIEADQAAFQHYREGVLTAACGTRLDHGVLAVGYGEDKNLGFWKIKNSWGESWGDKGYVLLARNGTRYNGDHGQCGVLMQPSYPIAK